MKVTAEHVRTIPGFSRRDGFCVNGMRLWCKRHGLSLKDSLRNGIEVERLEAIGDAFALALVEHARKMEADRGR